MDTPEINIASILQDCPKGAPLYSTPFGVVYFQGINDNSEIITIDENGRMWSFYSDGTYMHNADECVLFPSHDQRNWSRFEPPVLPPFEVKRVPNDIYSFVDSYGEADSIMDYAGDRDKYRWEHGNYFNNREQAEYAAKKVKELLLSLRKEEEK